MVGLVQRDVFVPNVSRFDRFPNQMCRLGEQGASWHQSRLPRVWALGDTAEL